MVDYPFDEQQLLDMGKSDLTVSLISAVCSNLHLVVVCICTFTSSKNKNMSCICFLDLIILVCLFFVSFLPLFARYVVEVS